MCRKTKCDKGNKNKISFSPSCYLLVMGCSLVDFRSSLGFIDLPLWHHSSCTNLEFSTKLHKLPFWASEYFDSWVSLGYSSTIAPFAFDKAILSIHTSIPSKVHLSKNALKTCFKRIKKPTKSMQGPRSYKALSTFDIVKLSIL
jgi:hypothetical protein